ncbi:hypothetical protein THASP1DRAFT_27885 [Thamnocephalis sphaerospora]|uniref:GCS light chain n=1 Tax=Thamnocephalis sphaerospora TaxID=78915 RepID=A0A4P9XVN3_9FUNG|nr:hypothetical protein THASP1DRAFT_27885 [Thamnocephalis sphaerospora]|eukprot:RKP10333.1 hypothetical protein THASP1DRAFT_27885 [Thamnocephalis sphaerospora]
MATLCLTTTAKDARTLIVQSGNLMHTNVTGLLNSALKRSQEEVLNAVSDTFAAATASSASAETVVLDDQTGTLTIRHPGGVEAAASHAKADDLDDLEVTAKLFLWPLPDGADVTTVATQQVDEALRQLRERVGPARIDNFTVAFAGFKLDDDEQDDDDDDVDSVLQPEQSTAATKAWPDMEYLVAVWRVLEQRHAAGELQSLGVCEFTKERLATFLTQIKVAPATNQVNLADCCIMPRTLIDYCRKNDIKLVTHSDACQPLAPEPLTQLWRGQTTKDGNAAARWVVKFSVMLESRGILHDKGYILRADVDAGCA